MKITTWISAIRTDNPNTHYAALKALQDTGQEDWWTAQEGEKRRIQLYRQHHKDPLIVLRFNVEPPADFNAKKVEYEVHKGDKVKVAVLLPGLHQNRIEDATTGEGRLYMTSSERLAAMQRFATRMGIESSSLKHEQRSPIYVKPSKGKKVVKPSFEAFIEGVIVDEAAFADAVLYGIGRSKTFGFGLIRFNKVS